MSSIYPVAVDENFTQDNFITYKVKNNQFHPLINEGDIIYIDRDDTKLSDGNVYLFSSKTKDMQIIRRITYTLKNELKIVTPTDAEIIDENTLLDLYFCMGRVRKRIAIIEENF